MVETFCQQCIFLFSFLIDGSAVIEKSADNYKISKKQQKKKQMFTN